MKLLQAGVLILFIVAIYPAFRWWSQNGPKAGEGDWGAALLALLGVAAFVMLLVWMVR
ncbi:MAG: hypothetical protein R3E86_20145 [Pseudomonadales bacterium]